MQLQAAGGADRENRKQVSANVQLPPRTKRHVDVDVEDKRGQASSAALPRSCCTNAAHRHGPAAAGRAMHGSTDSGVTLSLRTHVAACWRHHQRPSAGTASPGRTALPCGRAYNASGMHASARRASDAPSRCGRNRNSNSSSWPGSTAPSRRHIRNGDSGAAPPPTAQPTAASPPPPTLAAPGTGSAGVRLDH